MATKKHLLALSFLFLQLAACGHSAQNYRPIVDGAANLSYESDLQECQTLATERSYLNDDVKTNIVAGAVLGGLLGAVDDDGSGAAGALIGALSAGAGKSWEARNDRKNIVIQCMQQRGHHVIG